MQKSLARAEERVRKLEVRRCTMHFVEDTGGPLNNVVWISLR